MEDQSLFPELDSPMERGDIERRLREDGYGLVAGVDEAGRGPLAGPVVAAAVILDEMDCSLIADSKTLKPNEREAAFKWVCRRALAVGLGLADPAEIDRINILQASLKAMARAVKALEPAPEYLLVDGNFPAPVDIPQRPLVKGDSRSLCIGAASIVAKVVRDRIMEAYDVRYPQYGLAGHKGYATQIHLKALAEHGPSPIHRLSFRGVKPA